MVELQWRFLIIDKLICIICPKGCNLEVDESFNVIGNACNRGIEYAKTELLNPVRMITSTVKIENSVLSRLPVRTSKPVAKDKIIEVMNEVNKVIVKAPVNLHDVIIENVLDLGINIISTRSVSNK